MGHGLSLPKLIGGVCAVLFAAACSSPSATKSSPKFEFEEVESRRGCGAAPTPDWFEERFHITPRIQPACAHSWAPDDRPIWFHTTEESINTVRGWTNSENYQASAVFDWQAGRDRRLKELAEQVSGFQQFEQDVQKEGIFWAVGKPYFRGRYFHLFECAPLMPTDRLVEAQAGRSHSSPPNFGWRVKNGVVKCRHSRGSLGIQILDDRSGPLISFDDLQEWKTKAIEKSKPPTPPEENRPFDYYPTYKRFYYLESSREFFETTRYLRSKRRCSEDADPPSCWWIDPMERVHWEYN